MTDIEKKALALVNEVREERDESPFDKLSRDHISSQEALCRTIEQFEAYKQDVSDAVESLVDMPRCDHDEVDLVAERLGRFIIPKPDPLVEVISSALREGSPFNEDGSHDYTAEAKVIAAAIEARGGRIVWEGQ